MVRLPSLLLLLLLMTLTPATAFGQLRVVGETKVERDKMARLQADGAPVGSAIVWDVDKEDLVDIEEMGSRFIFTGPPGVYKVKCRALSVQDGRTIVQTVRVTVTVTGKSDPIPPPPVPPNPGPTPPPPPPVPVVVKTLWILVVEETGEASSERGAFFGDKDLQARVRDKGHRYRVTDKDVRDAKGNVPKDLAPWLEKAKGKKLPQLFLISQDGDVLYEGNMVATPKDLIALMAKVGG